MKHDASISVIIPAYNAESCLKRCLESTFAQTLRPAEVIVINDGSTDHTAEVARSYGDQIVYLEQDNQGQGAARNAGLGVAGGKFIAFLDADDYWLPGFIRTCVGFLLSHEETIAVSTSIIVRMFDGSELSHPAQFRGNGGSENGGFVIDNFFDFWARFNHVRTGSNVIRRAVIEKAGPQRADLRISQDLEYWGYLATFGRWGFIPEPLWVGNSRQAARMHGWSAKYAMRRRLCPDVEQWGTRIEPRLKPCEWAGYETIRGRVAMSYAQSKILAGARESAYRIVKKHGSTMPICTMRHIMVAGASLGRPGWLVACAVIRFKEWLKALRVCLGQHRIESP
ncbi:hypothetical protein ES703_29801 [subsurface metagenome]